MTLETKIAAFKLSHPTIKTGSDETGYKNLLPTEYEATITKWAENEIEQELTTKAKLAAEKATINAKASRDAKLAKMGFTLAEIENW